MRALVGLIALVLVTLLGACGPSDPAASAATSDATASPSGSIAGSAPPESAREIAIDDWVTVVADEVNLRSDPSVASPSHGLVVSGSEALVAAGPIEADGYAWYALDAVALTDSAADCELLPPNTHCPMGFGWVAAASPEGEPWLARAELECAAPPTTVAELHTVLPGHRLPCFGGQPLTLRGFLSPESPGRGCAIGDYTVTPVFLDVCPGTQFLQATETAMQGDGPEMAIHVHEDIGACDFGGFSPETCALVPHVGQWVEVDGMYHHPDAKTCVADTTSRDPPHPDVVVFHCRALFVVTAIGPGD